MKSTRNHKLRRHRMLNWHYSVTEKGAYKESLTNDVLDDHFDSTKGHVTAWYLVGCSRSPFIGRDRLQEVLDSRKELHGLQFALLEIRWDVAS